MELGMVGLGRMGANMVERLVRGGHRLVGYDRDAAAGSVSWGRIDFHARKPDSSTRKRGSGYYFSPREYVALPALDRATVVNLYMMRSASPWRPSRSRGDCPP